MRARNRRSVALSAALLAASLLLSACGRGADGVAAVEPDVVDDSPASGSLTVWAMGGEGENLPQLAERFEQENPDVDVEVTAVPWQSAHDKLANSIAAQATPDMAMIGTTWMAEFAAAKGLRPVPEDLVDETTFFAGNQATTEYRGRSWGVPWYADARILIYRQDLLEEAGVEVPATWDDYDEFNEQLKAAGVQWPSYLSSGGDGTTNMLLPFIWQTGGRIMNEDYTEFTIDTPEVLRALEYYTSIFEDGYSPVEGLAGMYQSMFVEGQIASYVSGPYEIAQLQALIEDAGKNPEELLGVAPMPQDTEPAAWTGGANLSVFRTAENPEAAWKFIDFLTRPQVQQDWYEITTDLPAVVEAWNSGPLAEGELLAPIRESIETGRATPPIVTWVQIDNMLNREIEKVVRGVQSPEEGVAAMQRKAELIGTGD